MCNCESSVVVTQSEGIVTPSCLSQFGLGLCSVSRLIGFGVSGANASEDCMRSLLRVADGLKKSGKTDLAKAVQEQAEKCAQAGKDLDEVAASMSEIKGVLEYLGDAEMASNVDDVVQELIASSNLQQDADTMTLQIEKDRMVRQQLMALCLLALLFDHGLS